MAHGLLHRFFGRLAGLDSNLNFVMRGRYIYFGDDNGPYANGVFDLTSTPGQIPIAAVAAVLPAGLVDNWVPAGYIAGQTTRLKITPTDATSILVGLPIGADGWPMGVYCDPASAFLLRVKNASSGTPGASIFVGGGAAGAIIDYAPGTGFRGESDVAAGGWLCA